MKLDVRKYLKRIRDTDDLTELEREFEEAIKMGRQFPDNRYDHSPILQWLATRKITGTEGNSKPN